MSTSVPNTHYVASLISLIEAPYFNVTTTWTLNGYHVYLYTNMFMIEAWELMIAFKHSNRAIILNKLYEII